jgi:hypothetical protein
MMSNVNETLKERGKVYGDYKGGSEFRANVMELIVDRYAKVNHGGMPAIHMVYVYDIVNKLSRLAVTPYHIDTWHDIAGYATLVEKALRKAEKQEQEQEANADDEYIKEFMDFVSALTGEDSDITQLAKEAYDEYKKEKENEQSKN